MMSARSGGICKLSLALGLAVLLLSTGCGDPNAVKTVPVSGVVKMNGEPLANAYVMFQPMRGQNAPASYARTDEQGHYSLKVITTEQKGAVPGPHKVLIELRDYEEDPADDESYAYNDSVPERYHNEETAPTFEVPEDGTEEANFNLESP
jgi:hypothetical protein